MLQLDLFGDLAPAPIVSREVSKPDPAEAIIPVHVPKVEQANAKQHKVTTSTYEWQGKKDEKYAYVNPQALDVCNYNFAAAHALVAYADKTVLEAKGIRNSFANKGVYTDWKAIAREINELNGRPASDRPAPTVESIAAALRKLHEPPPTQIKDLADSGHWLFADGGVISDGKGVGSRSTAGVTWAWVLVADGVEIARQSGRLLPSDIGSASCTSPQAEIYALCQGVLSLPAEWKGTVATDCLMAIHWMWDGYDTSGLPQMLRQKVMEARKIAAPHQHVLLAGHPRPADLAAGTRQSKAPHLPVSKWNVLCDDLCGLAKDKTSFVLGETK